MLRRYEGITWVFVIAATSAGVALQSLGYFRGGEPSITSPCPVPLFVLAAILGPYAMALVILAVPFAWCTPLLAGNPRIPTRTVWLTLAAGAGSFSWYVAASVRGLNTASPAYRATTAFASALFFSTALFLALRGRRHPSLACSGLAHLFLFVWLCSYAFTWFGEVP
jgi:hypothetical protein